jgi:hypothetical protein
MRCDGSATAPVPAMMTLGLLFHSVLPAAAADPEIASLLRSPLQQGVDHERRQPDRSTRLRAEADPHPDKVVQCKGAWLTRLRGSGPARTYSVLSTAEDPS